MKISYMAWKLSTTIVKNNRIRSESLWLQKYCLLVVLRILRIETFFVRAGGDVRLNIIKSVFPFFYFKEKETNKLFYTTQLKKKYHKSLNAFQYQGLSPTDNT